MKRNFNKEIEKSLPKRHKKIKLDRSIFEDFFHDVESDYNGVDSTYECVSKIWGDIILDYEVNIFRHIKEREITHLISSYENYYVDGISDGASSGMALNDSKLMLEKSIRNHKRAISLYRSLTSVEEKELYLSGTKLPSIYSKVLKDISIPESIFIGQAWYWDFPNSKIHFELTDYIYFSQMCISIISLIKAKNILMLGDGSGVNCALINENIECDLNITHVDLAQYLLMQYMVNYKWKERSSYIFAENFAKSGISDIDLLINMDSFPEMTNTEVKKYVNFIKKNKVKYVLSYNHIIIKSLTIGIQILENIYSKPICVR